MKGFEAQLRNLEISKNMKIEVSRCLLKKKGWAVARSITKLILMLMAAFGHRKTLDNELPYHFR